MFVLRAKCKLSDASAEVALFGVAGAPPAAMLGDAAGLAARARTAPRRRSACPTPPACSAPSSPRRPAARRRASRAGDALATWRWLEVESGIVTIEAATVDRFVPQMVNFELVGGVDFQKGCYPGQEVVARSQYRGTTKRRTLLFDCDAVPVAGQDVFVAGDAGEPAGTVANAAPHPEHRAAARWSRCGSPRSAPTSASAPSTGRALQPARAALPRPARRRRAGLTAAMAGARAVRLVPRAARARRRARAAVVAAAAFAGRRMARPAARACSFATKARRRPGWRPTRSPSATPRRRGIDAARIEAAIAAATRPLAALIDGARHVEAFDAVA